MKKKIWPSAVKGHLQAPPSKSAAQRAIAIASLARGDSLIINPGHCDDVLAAINVGRAMGAQIKRSDDNLYIKGRINDPKNTWHCGESGLSIRMFSGLAATMPIEVSLTGEGSLLKRPMSTVEESLSALDIKCSTNKGCLPIHVKGPIPGGKASIDGSLSSQVLTGILIASIFAENDLELAVRNLQSKPYIDLTIKIMQSFGVEVSHEHYQRFYVRKGQVYQGCQFKTEGDWSGASFPLVAGAVRGRVTVNNLELASAQADRKITDALQKAGALLEYHPEGLTVSHKKLTAFSFDATHCPDLFPPLVALAAYCDGESTIQGCNRLKGKESDRAETLTNTFNNLGIYVRVNDNTMHVRGGQVQPATIHSRGDHRIAMAAAIAALGGNGPVEIEQAEAVNKSYPDFFKHIASISSR